MNSNIIFKHKYFLGTFIILLLLASLPAAFKLTQKPKEVTKPKAQETIESAPPSQTEESSFFSNELLIKVTKETKGQLKENAKDTGIASLDKIFKEHRIKEFKQIANETKNSLPGHELFQWYKITLDDNPEKVTAVLDRVSYKLTQRMEERKENSPEKVIPRGQEEALMRLQEIIDKLSQGQNVEAIEPNFLVSTQSIPNDIYADPDPDDEVWSTGAWGQTWEDLWGLEKINAASAWNQATGSASVIVAVVDTGVDRNHPDLASNMWVNTKETPNNGKDDDLNGYIDDYYGWDFANNDKDPLDDHGHGTHCSGTIGAVGNNNLGVAGVNWTTKIMALKFLSSSGSGSTDNGIKALTYAADNGAKVSSNSWGGGGFSQAMDDAIKYEHDKGMVTVTAAGNNNSDAIGFSPANSQYAITVSATNHNDVRAAFSNWGEKIDVGAPGGDSSSYGGIDDYILSLKASSSPMCTSTNTVGTNYCIVRGTSMACPHVAGLSALLLAKNPSLTNEEVRQVLRMGADDIGTAGKDKDFGYGRINAANSLNYAFDKALTPVITAPSSNTLINQTTYPILGTVKGENFSSFNLEVGSGRAPSSWTLLNQSSVPVENGELGTFNVNQFPDGIYIIKLTAFDINGRPFSYQVYDITVDNFDVLVAIPPMISLGEFKIKGTANVKNALILDNYILDYAINSNTGSWFTEGITLTNNGTSPIIGDVLGSIDTRSLTPNTAYTLRLRVYARGGLMQQTTASVKLDSDLVTGWPKTYSTSYIYNNQVYNRLIQYTPTFSDLDSDGNKEIIIVSPENLLYVYRKDGSVISGFPVRVAPVYTPNVSTLTVSDVNVDDLDNDGNQEIVVLGDALYIIDNRGRIVSSNPVLKSGASLTIMTPVIVDIDRDNKKELVVVQRENMGNTPDGYSFNLKLHIFDNKAVEKTGYPKVFATNVLLPGITDWWNGSVAHVSDLNNDGAYEISYSLGNYIYLISSGGEVLPGWPFTVPDFENVHFIYTGTLVSGDINGDGKSELIAYNQKHCNVDGGCGSGSTDPTKKIVALYAWDIKGNVLPNFPVRSGIQDSLYNSLFAPSLVDLDEDGKDEIIVNNGIFDETGIKIVPLYNSYSHSGSLSINDINRDGFLDFTGAYYYSLMTYDETGKNIFTKYGSSNPFCSNIPIPVSDLDNNGKVEIGWSNCSTDTNELIIYLWEVPNNGTAPLYSWPMFKHDPQKTGKLIIGNEPTITPRPTSIFTPTPFPAPTEVPTPYPTTPVISTPTPTPSGDFIPPIVAITSPKNGTLVTKKISVKVTATATDESGISSITVYLDSAPLVPSCTKSPCSYSLSVANLSKGVHTLRAVAIDKSPQGNTSSIISSFTLR